MDAPQDENTGTTQGERTEKVGPGHPPKSRQFGQPGGNPRNVRGVPKDALELRRLIKQIGAEKLAMPDGSKTKEIRRLEALIKAMYSSKAPADRAAILKAGWPGILREEVDLTSGGDKIVVTLKGKDE